MAFSVFSERREARAGGGRQMTRSHRPPAQSPMSPIAPATPYIAPPLHLFSAALQICEIRVDEMSEWSRPCCRLNVYCRGPV